MFENSNRLPSNKGGSVRQPFKERRKITFHRKQIMDKLNIRNVAELTKYAIRTGLTDLE